MFKLLKNGVCYSPQVLGKTDILVVCGKIGRIQNDINTDGLWDVEIIDCTNKVIFPGLIDQHVHIIGGGGENGPESEIPEISLQSILSAGISTVVGLLGTDGITKNMPALLSKAYKLAEEGVNTYIYSGNYSVPPVTLTGSILTDLIYIEKVIGSGEIAISDYRSSYPSSQALKQVAHESMLGGLLGKKPGVMHIHVGDGKKGLEPLSNLISETDFPAEMFVPTHINRNRQLFYQGLEHVKHGGRIDLTAGEKTGKGYSIPDALEIILSEQINIDNITISSDGNGSTSAQSGSMSEAASVGQMLEDIRACIINKGLDPVKIFSLATINVAKLLKMFPKKGTIAQNSDADLIILNQEDFTLDTLMINGNILFSNGVVLKAD